MCSVVSVIVRLCVFRSCLFVFVGVHVNDCVCV